MGAYSNPPLLVDTQTGEHFRNLQSSIATSFAGFAQSYVSKQERLKKEQKENQQRLEEINNQTEEYSMALRSGINKLKPLDSTINMPETFEPLIQEAVKLKSGLLNNTITGENRQKAMQKLADINSTISGNFSTSLADLSGYASILDNARLKPVGTPGGLAASMNTSDIEALSILQGKLEGTKKAVYKDNDPNNLFWQIYKGDTLIKEYSAANLKKFSDLGGELVKVVPDFTSEFERVMASKDNIWDVKVVKGDKIQSTGNVKPEFLSKEPPVKIEIGEKGSGIYKLITKVDKEKIKVEMDPIVDSLARGLADEELMLHINNTVNNYFKDKDNKKVVYFDDNNILDPQEKEAAIQAYKDYFYSAQIKSEQPMLKEDGDVLIMQEDTVQKVKTKSVPKEKAIKPKFTDVSKLIWEQKEGSADDFTWGNKKVSYDGAVFTIASGPNKGIAFNTKKEVIEYLKTGKIK